RQSPRHAFLPTRERALRPDSRRAALVRCICAWPRPARPRSKTILEWPACRPARCVREQVQGSFTSSKLWRSIAQIIGFIQFTARDLGGHRMEMAHRLDQARILDRERWMAGTFLEESPTQRPTHECAATGIQPEPLERKALRMRDRQDVEGEIDEVHQPRPDAERHHVREYVFHIDPQQRQEWNEEMAENDDNSDRPPSAP